MSCATYEPFQDKTSECCGTKGKSCVFKNEFANSESTGLSIGFRPIHADTAAGTGRLDSWEAAGGGKCGTGGGKTDLAFGFPNWTADELVAGIAAFGPDYSNLMAEELLSSVATKGRGGKGEAKGQNGGGKASGSTGPKGGKGGGKAGCEYPT